MKRYHVLRIALLACLLVTFVLGHGFWAGGGEVSPGQAVYLPLVLRSRWAAGLTSGSSRKP